jgi:hypothetical protein
LEIKSPQKRYARARTKATLKERSVAVQGPVLVVRGK